MSKTFGAIRFERENDGLHWSVKLPAPLNLSASGVVLETEGYTSNREIRAAITAIRIQLQEWERDLRYAE
jgi:hypothetical protein